LNVIATEHAQSGGCIAAPTTYNSENGYVFANCLITADGFQQGTYYLARGWQNSPAAIFVLTKFAANPSSKYWGDNINALTSRRFAAYSTGAQNDPGATSISKASLTGFASGWDPAEIISQHSPIKTNAAGWASYTAFTDVYIKGSDVKAYTAIQINKNSVLLKTIDDKVIPAGTAVFVKGAEKTAYYVNGALVGSPIIKNYLKPVLFDQLLTSSSNAFVIGTKDGQPGLYRVSPSLLIPEGKCYLDASSASLALAKEQLEFVFAEGETTGIDNVVAGSDGNATRYNLAGQKVGNDYKGIVVKGGKKYLAK
jgi:3D (Asp-Asp-Asp) domain-containing protein